MIARMGAAGLWALGLAAMLAAGAPAAGWAQDLEVTASEAITVWGKRQSQIGEAFTASEGVVDFGAFVDRPLLRVGELAEVVPGLAATQHSGTGKANQYFLRGFNLDHGTDFSISVDGVPANLRTHAHGQGYLDINFIIPEIVDRIVYRKGVYNADVGDFSAAGSAAFRTFDRLPESFVQGEIGEDGWRRAVAGVNLGDIGYVALDYTEDDGPWVDPEGFQKVNGFLKLAHGPWSASAGYYDSEWNATDQIPLRAVQSGLISRLDDIDDSVGGETRRLWLNGAYQDTSGLSANLYVVDYELSLFSNFTYFLDDPVNGDQFEQSEERTIYGGTIAKAFAPLRAWTPRVGAEFRIDDIGPIGLYRNAGRVRLSTTREDEVLQRSVGVWGDVSGEFGRLRLNLGLRADAMDVDITSDTPENSGAADDALISPKASAAYRFADWLEGYASAGRGFHSNDARGATITLDPASGDPAERVPLLVPGVGGELGVRAERGGFQGSLTVWTLELDSELVYVGDAGATEASNGSRRIGVEALASWTPARWLSLDASAAYTDAQFEDAPAGEDRIPLAVEYVLTGGATVQFAEAWTGTLTLRHLGPAPLIEDGSVESDPSTLANGRIAYRAGRFLLALEALNLFDSQDADITYFYASRLPGEAEEGVEDIHFHPIPPRSLRLQARVNF